MTMGDVTPIQLSKEEQKKLKKKEYQKRYMEQYMERMKTDVVLRERRKTAQANYYKSQSIESIREKRNEYYNTNTEYRERRLQVSQLKRTRQKQEAL